MEFIGKRISLVKTDNELSVVIAATEKKSQTYFLFFWLTCFTFCGCYIIFELLQNPTRDVKVFLAVFAAFWLYFEYRTIKAIRWKLYGKEVIKIKGGKLFVKRDVNKHGKVFVYDTSFVNNLRIKEFNANSVSAVLSSADWLELREVIAFDYYGKETKFGYQLNDDESQELLKQLKYFLKKQK
jgi:hypothetical protein